MGYEVLRVPSVGRAVSGMSGRERRAYDAAVRALWSEGCRVGGKQLVAADGADYPMCQRSLYGTWRLTTVFRSDRSIVIVAIARRTKRGNPSASLAAVFPGLSAVGRRRSKQPPCCEDPEATPLLSPDLESMLFDVSGAYGI